jgi:hypothetical protein
VNNYIKKLLALVHEGSLLMDMLVSINFDLITTITGLPTDGEKLEQYMDDKTKENALAEELKKTHETKTGS